MSNAFSESRKGQATSPKTPTPKARQPKPNMPQASKVLVQHAITKTQGNVAEIHRVGEMRTQVVLQTFDEVMAQSDRDIIEGLEQRLGGSTDSFFGDIDQQFAAMLTGETVTALPAVS